MKSREKAVRIMLWPIYSELKKLAKELKIDRIEFDWEIGGRAPYDGFCMYIEDEDQMGGWRFDAYLFDDDPGNWNWCYGIMSDRFQGPDYWKGDEYHDFTVKQMVNAEEFAIEVFSKFRPQD